MEMNQTAVIVTEIETVPFMAVAVISELLDRMTDLTPAQKRLAVRTALMLSGCAE